MKKLHTRMSKRLGAGGAVAVWLVGGTALVAAAAILLLLTMTGSVSVVSGPALKYLSSTAAADGSGIVCNSTVSSDKKSVTIAVTNAMPGSSCDFTTVVASDKAGFVVQDLSLGPNLTVEKLGTAAVCNAQVGEEYLSGTTLKWRLTVPPTATTGTISIPAGAGVKVTAAGQYDATACTVK